MVMDKRYLLTEKLSCLTGYTSLKWYIWYEFGEMFVFVFQLFYWPVCPFVMLEARYKAWLYTPVYFMAISTSIELIVLIHTTEHKTRIPLLSTVDKVWPSDALYYIEDQTKTYRQYWNTRTDWTVLSLPAEGRTHASFPALRHCEERNVAHVHYSVSVLTLSTV